MKHVRHKNTELSTKIGPVFYLFLAYIVIWYAQLAERWSEMTGGLRFEAIITVVLLSAVLLGKKDKSKQLSAGFLPFIISYLIVLLIQVANSWDSSYSWFIFVERVLKYSVMAIFIIHFVDTPQKLKIFIFVWLLVAFKILSEGVIGGITGSMSWQNQGVMRLRGSTELYGHPNSLSQFAIGVIPFIYYLYPTFKDKLWLRVSGIILLLSSIYCVLGTNSRTGFLGVIFFLLFIFWKSHIRDKMKLILFTTLILLPIAVSYIPEETKGRFSSIFGGKEAEGNSKEGRIEMYSQGWHIFTEHPLGLGLGNYRLANYQYYNFSQEVHNLALEALTHIGIHGFLIFTILILKIRSVLISIIKKADNINNKNPDHEFIIATAKALLVYLYLRLFFGIFGMDLYSMNWWFIIGSSSVLFTLIMNNKVETSK